MTAARYLDAPVAGDLGRKMVFVAGPRQVGKTTLARRALDRVAAEGGEGVYLSWDNRAERKAIRAAAWPASDALVVLDELHKWGGWKGWLKGEYDAHRERIRFLVTGSARLDVYRRGGDSLQGRYHHYRLHPFTVAEVATGGTAARPEPGRELPIPSRGPRDLLESLLEFGGFPEPLLAADARTHRRWQKERIDRFFREDVRDLEPLRDLSHFELFADLLPERVGSPLSLNAIREDLEVSHRAATHWADVLDRLYHVFRVRPFASPRARTLSRMPKAYLWDWSLVPDRGARLENLVALHLLKLCHLLEDADGHDVRLHYLRDRDGREADFLVVHRGKPWFAVEVKTSETQVHPALRYFRDRLRVPWAYQVVLETDRDVLADGVRVLPVAKFLAALV